MIGENKLELRYTIRPHRDCSKSFGLVLNIVCMRFRGFGALRRTFLHMISYHCL